MHTTQHHPNHPAGRRQGVIALFVFMGLFFFSQRVDSQSLYPPHIDITDIWVTKFDLKDMDEKDICNLLLFIGNNFDGTDDLVTAPNCTDCGPIIYAVPQTTTRSDVFRERDSGMLFPFFLLLPSLFLPSFFHSRVFFYLPFFVLYYCICSLLSSLQVNSFPYLIFSYIMLKNSFFVHSL